MHETEFLSSKEFKSISKDCNEIPRILKEIEVGKELRQSIIQAYAIKSIVAPIKVKNFRLTSKT